MEDTFTILLATSTGAAIAIFGQYMTEKVRARNEKYKFSFEKIISIGEKYYEYSGLALLQFEAVLAKYEKVDDFKSEDAKKVYQTGIDVLTEQSKALMQRTHTIVAADIYFKISKIEVANNFIKEHQLQLAILFDILDSHELNKRERATAQLEIVKGLLREYIGIINSDRKIISTTINELMHA